MSESIILTIDGPGGAGKGTVSRLLADKLGWHYLESGALYRALAIAASQRGVGFDNEPALIDLASHMNLRFETDQGNRKVVLDRIEITKDLGSEACGNAASKIAANPRIREVLVEKQQAFQQPPGLVAEGRDMGTVIFPYAKYKVFLTASVDERARRRYLQLKQTDNNVSLDAIRHEIEERDLRDTTRNVAPLKQAQDAALIDCTTITIDDVVKQCLDIIGQ
ncbi:MAG: (d)CMP kinase [Methylococcales bacterium]